MYWYMKVLRNYVGFSGRARRREYWMFALVNVLVVIGLMLVDMVIGAFDPVLGIGLLSGIYSLAVLIPGIAVSVRRLHDRDMSGWWLLIALIPLIGGLVLLVLFVLEGTQGENRFGPDPKLEPDAMPAMV